MSTDSKQSRRSFFTRVAAVSAAGAVTFAAQIPRSAKKLRLGGPIFIQSDDPEMWAEAHRSLGYRAAYAPQVDVSDTDRINAVRQAAAARDVLLAEVGAWVNALDPDPVKRSKNVAYITEQLALAEALGARCCVAIAGSFNPQIWYGPHPGNFSREFFDLTVETTRRIIDAVQPTRTKYSLEMMGWALPSGPEEYMDLLRAIDRPAFGVHLDICNAVNSPTRMYQNTQLIRHCFELLGPWVVSCHAKDVDWIPAMQVHFVEVIPGRGLVDYPALLEGLAGLPHDVPLMLEHLQTAEEYAEGAAFIRQTGVAMGLEFE
ncbi:MAG TPA: TIM barrel protein [Acidobacteriota bacterium]|nr:TIM barrel protein [Acidobacteriota bacterium]